MKNTAIHNNTIKQYLKIAITWPHYFSGSTLLQMTLKYFNFLFTVV